MSISGMINYGKPFKRNRLLRCMDMANILKKIFGDGNQRQLNRVQKIVNHIEAMEPDMEKLSDSELQQKTEEFNDRYQNGETLDDILTEAYAVVRKVANSELQHHIFNVLLVGVIDLLDD